MIIEQLFVVTAAVGAVIAIMNLVGANIYDLREVRKQRQLSLHPYSRQNRHRPLISIVISTRNDERMVGRCLDSLLSSSYRKYEILVIDNASSDKTKNIVKQFSASHPAKTVRLVARHSVQGNLGVMVANYKRYGQGEIALWLDPGSRLDKYALANAIKHFNSEPGIGILRPSRRVMSALSTVGLFQNYQELLRYRAKKFASVSNSDYTPVGETALYRREAFVALSKKPALNQAVHPYYASDVMAYVEPQTSFYKLLRQHYRWQLGNLQALWTRRRLFFRHRAGHSRFLTWFRLPLAACAGIISLFVPLLLSYFIYVAISLREPSLLILSWASLGILLLLAIWGDEHLRFRQKAVYSALMPATYAIFYVLSFVPVLVMLRTAIPVKRT